MITAPSSSTGTPPCRPARRPAPPPPHPPALVGRFGAPAPMPPGPAATGARAQLLRYSASMGQLGLVINFGRIRCPTAVTVAPDARDDYTHGVGSCCLGWQICEDRATTSPRAQKK